MNLDQEEVVYISGPMTAADPNSEKANRNVFHLAARRLKAAGYQVLNPAELDLQLPPLKEGDEPRDRQWYMHRDLREILNKATMVATLPGWQDSQGATLEVFVATQTGIPVCKVSDMVIEEEDV